jgi:hypothetical protein
MQCNTITHITQINIHLSRQLSIRKITRINQEHILHTIKTQKLIELEVDETVLKANSILYSTQLHTLHQDLHVTPVHSPSQIFCLHHCGITEWRQRTFRELDCESEFRRLVAQKDSDTFSWGKSYDFQTEHSSTQWMFCEIQRDTISGSK